MADVGHNTGSVAADRLRSIVARIEALEEQRRAIGEDIKDIYTEAKSAGFVPKVLRNLIAERRRAAGEVSEEQMLLETYKRALGMISDLPLGKSSLGKGIPQ
jgi:uncharacterized protein (UPF0335 family)